MSVAIEPKYLKWGIIEVSMKLLNKTTLSNIDKINITKIVCEMMNLHGGITKPPFAEIHTRKTGVNIVDLVEKYKVLSFDTSIILEYLRHTKQSTMPPKLPSISEVVRAEVGERSSRGGEIPEDCPVITLTFNNNWHIKLYWAPCKDKSKYRLRFDLPPNSMYVDSYHKDGISENLALSKINELSSKNWVTIASIVLKHIVKDMFVQLGIGLDIIKKHPGSTQSIKGNIVSMDMDSHKMFFAIWKDRFPEICYRYYVVDRVFVTYKYI